MNRWRLLVALTAAIAMMLAAAVLFGPATPAPADVTTNNQTNLRTGWYSNQPGLSPSAV
jgi:hypothetical protein